MRLKSRASQPASLLSSHLAQPLCQDFPSWGHFSARVGNGPNLELSFGFKGSSMPLLSLPPFPGLRAGKQRPRPTSVMLPNLFGAILK